MIFNSIIGFTDLSASTGFACVGEDVTFSCVTSSFILIWTVTTTDRTIGPRTRLFHISDNPGKSVLESTDHFHLRFELLSNADGILNSTLIAHTSTVLQNAVISCEGESTQSLVLRFACN